MYADEAAFGSQPRWHVEGRQAGQQQAKHDDSGAWIFYTSEGSAEEHCDLSSDDAKYMAPATSTATASASTAITTWTPTTRSSANEFIPRQHAHTLNDEATVITMLDHDILESHQLHLQQVPHELPLQCCHFDLGASDVTGHRGAMVYKDVAILRSVSADIATPAPLQEHIDHDDLSHGELVENDYGANFNDNDNHTQQQQRISNSIGLRPMGRHTYANSIGERPAVDRRGLE